MNERIRELAEQADLLGNFTPTKISGHYAGIIKITDIEKFAELIVQDCLRFVEVGRNKTDTRHLITACFLMNEEN
jgi:hypothetical protein